jgi:hypothetical protein
VSGPGTITFGSQTANSSSVSASTEGAYVIRLSATDLAGNTATSDINFTWDTTAPTIGVIADIQTNIMVTVSPTGSGAVSYAWSKVSGPGTITFGSQTANSTSVSASTDGAYVIRLSATDLAGNAATRDINFTWDTAAPTIGAVADILTSSAVTVSPTVSGASSYAWSKVSGPGTITFGSQTSESSTVSASTVGAYVIRLSAADLAGNTATRDINFTWQTGYYTLPQNAVSYVQIGSNNLRSVFVSGSTIYAATWGGGLSISSDGGATWANKTTANGLVHNRVNVVFVSGSTVYAATDGGLSISSNGGATWANKTTTNGLGHNQVRGVFASGSTVYAATSGGLSISSDGGATFTNKTTANGLGSNSVSGVFASGSTVYVATWDGGLSVLNPIPAVQ